MPASPLPTPLAGVPTTPLPLPTPTRPSRWSLAVQAGPALTYRLLGAATDSAGPGLSRLERPALGYAGQLQVGYAATPRLRLSTGLGYVEYATHFNAVVTAARVQTFTSRRVQVFSNGTRRDTLVFVTSHDSIVGTTRTSLRQRDTYRYLTVPLQARLRLGTAGRWSYDVLAGAALGLYLGGRTTQGSSACACEQISWRPGNSPFRVATALLTVGAAAEYELRPGWHVLLQPVLQQALHSISESPRPARRPLGLSVQTGMRFDLP
ncbi:hypothetical protein GCM10028821_01860 [Hymenobacter jeollabukensis]